MSRVDIDVSVTEQEARFLRDILAVIPFRNFKELREELDNAGFRLQNTRMKQSTRNDLEKVLHSFRSTVKVGDKEYYEDELAEALKNIKPL